MKVEDKSRFEVSLQGTEDLEQPAQYDERRWERHAARAIQGHTILWVNERRTGAILTVDSIARIQYMVHGTNRTVIGNIMTRGLKADPKGKGEGKTCVHFSPYETVGASRACVSPETSTYRFSWTRT